MTDTAAERRICTTKVVIVVDLRRGSINQQTQSEPTGPDMLPKMGTNIPTSIPGSSSSWCPASTRCPSCLSCSLLRRRRASSLIKLPIHLMWCRSQRSAILDYIRTIAAPFRFSGFHTYGCTDELVVHELQQCMVISRCTLPLCEVRCDHSVPHNG